LIEDEMCESFLDYSMATTLRHTATPKRASRASSGRRGNAATAARACESPDCRQCDKIIECKHVVQRVPVNDTAGDNDNGRRQIARDSLATDSQA
jgi:hypothetical protein